MELARGETFDAKMMKLARDYAIYRMYDGKGPNGERILVHDSPPKGTFDAYCAEVAKREAVAAAREAKNEAYRVRMGIVRRT